MSSFLHLHQLGILLGVSLLLSFFDWGKRVTFPFQIFTTWVHECWHALAALLMGGGNVRITLAADGSGVTSYTLPKGKLRHAMVSSAGYVGASATGCLIVYCSIQSMNRELPLHPSTLLFTLFGLIVFTLLFWIRNAFGWISVALMAAALGGLGYSSYVSYSGTVLMFLGIQTALNAVFDLRNLFSVKASSDAHTLQKLFYLPAWFWAFLWLAMSLGLMYFTARLSFSK